ncbi:MAG: multiheme c-type cytochrome [Candidatus Eisenbacteria bacterium]|nr:cytochrome c family protein [Candidatus Eisenbacteria bacterium]
MKIVRSLALIGALALLALAVAVVQNGQAQQQADAHKFIGTEQCKMCHKNIYDTWLTTDHAKAFDILPKESQANMTCLGCHATGAGKAGGYDPKAEKNLGLTGVGCEVCHGAASDYKMVHMKDKAKAATLGMVVQPTADNCKLCHAGKVPEGHKPLPPFDFTKAWLKIEHHLPKK